MTSTTALLLDDRLARNIAAAVVEQAVEDWKRLCSGAYGMELCNFNELDEFFQHRCGIYLEHEEAAKKIYARLRQERERKVKWWENTSLH